MSGVLHPVGPEPAQTYWARRAVVIAALVLALALVVAGVVSLVRAGSATAAPPPAGPQPAPVSSGASTEVSDAFTQSPEPEPPVPDPDATARQSAAPKSPKSPSPSATAAALSPCEPAALRPTLTGSQRLEVKKATSFELSLINGSKQTCAVTVSSANFSLTIYSGTDRIWSTADCRATVKKLAKTLRSEQDLTWKVVWNGRRSAANCKQRPEVPAAGTYVATAEFEGAEPVQLRVLLHS